MPNFKTRIHCIGEPENGIVIVTFDPFRVVTIGWPSIQAYAATLSDKPDATDTYRMLCKALTALVLDLCDEDSMLKMDEQTAPLSALSSMGVRIDNADLCLTGRIDADLHNQSMSGTTSRRKGYSMLHQMIDILLADSHQVPFEMTPVIDTHYDGSGHDHGDGHDH